MVDAGLAVYLDGASRPGGVPCPEGAVRVARGGLGPVAAQGRHELPLDVHQLLHIPEGDLQRTRPRTAATSEHSHYVQEAQGSSDTVTGLRLRDALDTPMSNPSLQCQARLHVSHCRPSGEG